MVAVGRVEHQFWRGPAMAAVEETAISPLPRPNWHDGEVEEVEGITVRLRANWATRSCGGA